jgi:hypothetical protein
MVREMREFNEKFEQFQVTAASILSLSDVMKQEVENLNVVKNDIGVMVANVSSLITNLEATLKTTKGVKVIPNAPEIEVREEVHYEKNKKLLMETNQICEKHLKKDKFKGIPKNVFGKIQLYGGFKPYMDKFYPKHTVSDAVFESLTKKGATVKEYQILDRELVRLTSPLHKRSYVEGPASTSLFKPIPSITPGSGSVYGESTSSSGEDRVTAASLLKLIKR